MIRSNPIFDKLLHFSTAESTICVLLLSFGVYVGTSKILTDGPGNFYSYQFGPAVMWACGHGLTAPVFGSTSSGQDGIGEDRIPCPKMIHLGFFSDNHKIQVAIYAR